MASSDNKNQQGNAGKQPDRQAIQAWLVERLALLINAPKDAIDVRGSLHHYGLCSADVISLSGELEEWLERRLAPTLAYEYPSIAALAAFLAGEPDTEGRRDDPVRDRRENGAIAIIGIACRFPGASNPDAFWQLLRNGVDAIGDVPSDRWNVNAFYEPQAGIPGKMNTRWGGFLSEVDQFDSFFFGISPREADRMDPQQRILMELAVEALEDAGIDAARLAGTSTGVFIGICTNEYGRFQYNNPAEVDSFSSTGNAMSIAANRLSYTFDLRGPSLAIDTACSSSLVATHIACRSLGSNESTVAIVGGVNLMLSPATTIAFSMAGALASDGRSKSFDARADGYTRSEGAGMLVLKPLRRAVHDRDRIYAVILGSAVNQDGRTNGLTAPNRHAQEAVLREAYHNAGVSPADVQYVEAHGTGTPLGDPIEAAALGAVLAEGRPEGQLCSIGSAKSFIGHLEAAAGIAGLIKAVLSIHHGEIPPSLHFQSPNRLIPFERLPLRVQRVLEPWPQYGRKRLAGVSSFGFGGTNSHVVLEEWPKAGEPSPSRPWQLLSLSAKTSPALDAATANLAAYLNQSSSLSLGDVAYTLHVGRTAFDCRRIAVCKDLKDAGDVLAACSPERVFHGDCGPEEPRIVFMFSGLGDHHINMARELYENEPSVRVDVDKCSDLLKEYLAVDLRDILYPPQEASCTPPLAGDGDGFRRLLNRAAAPEDPDFSRLNQTVISQPAVFAIEYALARLLMRWNIKPKAMIGYSLGEYVAACLAGVFTLEDALFVVAHRARMIQQVEPGAMLAISLPSEELQRRLPENLCIAAVNTPSVCVVAGPVQAVRDFENQCTADGVICCSVQATHAFHSKMMENLVPAFTELVGRVRLAPPQIPYISNVTGTWAQADEVTKPGYWARHLRQTVRFEQGIRELLAEDGIFLEIGPGQTLCSIASQFPCNQVARQALSCLPHFQRRQSEMAFLLSTLGKLWLAGARPDWQAFYENEDRQRLRLPHYPFERQRHWFVPSAQDQGAVDVRPALSKNPDPSHWFYAPCWQPDPLKGHTEKRQKGPWLVFIDETNLGARVLQGLQERVGDVIIVRAREEFSSLNGKEYTLDPQRAEDYKLLFTALYDAGKMPGRIVHFWNVFAPASSLSDSGGFDKDLVLGFGSLANIAKALGSIDHQKDLEIKIVSSHLQRVNADDQVCPSRAALSGVVRVLPQEYRKLRCASIDLALPQDAEDEHAVVSQLLLELESDSKETVVAYRNGQRLVQRFAPLVLNHSEQPARLHERGVYLITGGLGGLGLLIAEHLARTAKARLLLAGRRPFPGKEQWDEWLAQHSAEDVVSAKIERLRAMERQGAEVLVVKADVADHAEMEAAVNAAEKRFGALQGIVHAAGIIAADAFVTLQDLRSSDAERHFRAKVRGLYALETIAGRRELDFILLLSSISTLLGGLGFAAYAAANAFMDSFAQHQSSLGRGVWTSIDLETWQTGEAAPIRSGSVAEYAMTAEEGIHAFNRILCTKSAAPRIVISTGDLEQRMAAQEARRAAVSATTVSRPKQKRAPRSAFMPASNDVERTILGVWQEMLGVDEIGIHDNFFDIGGNSLIGMQIVRALQQKLGMLLTPVAMFEAPTASSLAKYIISLQGGQEQQASFDKTECVDSRKQTGNRDIAIIAMNGRFPGARNVDEFWQNLIGKVESVFFFTDEELLASGVPAETVNDPRYVKARPVLEGADLFDARFFRFSPREADLTDPQQRIFLECAWEAMELAGYSSEQYQGITGVFAGTNMSTYLFGRPELARSLSPYQIVAGNDKDSLATSTSYRLNLTGPSITVQTHCSTSLVATHLACQSLLNGECDMALAGGVSVRIPQKIGYIYEPGGQDSPDGHTRSFDAKARGTVLGDGVGIVVLKRLEDALADGDRIHAVIRGSAVNNDGDLKVGFVAPSVEGQSRAVSAALKRSGVDPRTVQYVEAHGSATEIGDPIEVTALTKAFREWTPEKHFCAIGSAKSNVGHLDKAAGVTGLIKATLALRHKMIPPSLNFEEANPVIDFANSPFYVPTEAMEWKREDAPRRAAVNSLGMGGTNVHMVLEEAPPEPACSESRPWQTLVLSAKSSNALDNSIANLADFLKTHPEENLADVAYTLQIGRTAFSHRCAVVCQDLQDAIASLESRSPGRMLSGVQQARNRIVTFVFPGVGDHYEAMGASLYQNERVFRQELDRCAEILRQISGPDLLTLLYPGGEQQQNGNGPRLNLRQVLRPARTASGEAVDPLRRTSVAQPLVFAVEYALARMLMSWGIVPQALIGYSLGEFVAATIAGAFSLEDALRLVTLRGRAIDRLSGGAMLSVPCSREDISPLLTAGSFIAINNGPNLHVISGSMPSISGLEDELQRRGIVSRRLSTTHAFHSPMMEPACREVEEQAQSIELKEPRIVWISNATGDWIKAEEAADPKYWAQHMCKPVRFAEGLAVLLKERDRVFIEVGPGQNLGSFIRQHPDFDPNAGQTVVACMRNSYENHPDQQFLLEAVTRLWLAGTKIDWRGFYTDEKRRRVQLPTYPFEKERHWLETTPSTKASSLPVFRFQDLGGLERHAIPDSFYLPAWKRTAPQAPLWPEGSGGEAACWLIFADQSSLSRALIDELRRRGQKVVEVFAGPQFHQKEQQHFTLRPEAREDYDALLERIAEQGCKLSRVVHLWTLATPQEKALEEVLKLGIYSLLYLAQAIERVHPACDISIVTSQMLAITGVERLQPAKATLMGPCRIIPVEYQHINCRCIDVNPAEEGEALLENLLAELASSIQERVVALRAAERWIESMEAISLPAERPRMGPHSWLRKDGVYLVTGGLGGIGLGMAEQLAKRGPVKLVLAGRTGLAPREEWMQIAGAGDSEAAGRIASKIRKVQRLEQLGAEVMVVVADVADHAQLKAAIRQALQRFGTLHGVIHAAGVPGVGLSQLKTPKMLEHVLSPKVHGVLTLEKVLEEEKIDLDFLALFSSVASITGGGPGQFDYCAANAFLDSYARRQSSRKRRTVSINWGEWQWDAWTEGLSTMSEEIRQYLKRTREKFGITMEEGWEALSRILSAPLSQVIVSTQDFQQVFAASQTFNPSSFGGRLEGNKDPSSRHRRPDLTVPFQAPASKMERLVAGIWEEFLGVNPVGVHDNFFELGGNSLIAMQILTRLRQIWGIDLPLSSISTNPTLAEQAVAAELFMIEKLESLTEEEAQSLI